MTNCDTCGVNVNTNGYLGGEIICHSCAEAERKGNDDVIEARKEKYGGGSDA